MKIGILGFGHLGKALVKGLLNDGFVCKEDIYVTANSKITKERARNEYGVHVCCSNTELIQATDIIFICVPANVFFSDFGDCGVVSEDKTFVSLMAGVTLSQLKQCIGRGRIMRAMPNLGIERNDGIICYTATDDQWVVKIMEHLGYSFCVPEGDIEKITAFASCGIGFAAYILNCFFEKGRDLGFSADTTMRIVDNIFRNALRAADYSELVDSVATKGGATEAGVMRLDEHKTNEIIGDVIDAAYRRMT